MERDADEGIQVVTNRLVDGDQCFLTRNFGFHFRSFDRAILQTVRGASHLKFTTGGLVRWLPEPETADHLPRKADASAFYLVWCYMLDGTHKADGFLFRARRKPQQ